MHILFWEMMFLSGVARSVALRPVWIFSHVLHRKAGGMGWRCGCCLESLRLVASTPQASFFTGPVWRDSLCPWSCGVTTRWQSVVRTGWLSGLFPDGGRSRLCGLGPFENRLNPLLMILALTYVTVFSTSMKWKFYFGHFILYTPDRISERLSNRTPSARVVAGLPGMLLSFIHVWPCSSPRRLPASSFSFSCVAVALV